MAQVEILYNPRCSKSRQTLDILNEREIDLKITEYLKKSLSSNEINNISLKLGLKPSQFLRKGEYSNLGITIAETEDGIIKQMEEYPILIERPIVIKGNKAKIGRPPESILEIL